MSKIKELHKLLSKSVISQLYNDRFVDLQVEGKLPPEKGILVYLDNNAPKYVEKIIKKFSEKLDKLKENNNISNEYPSLKNNDYIIFYNKVDNKIVDNKLYIFCFENLKEKEIALKFKLISEMMNLVEIQKKVLNIKTNMVQTGSELAEVRKELLLDKKTPEYNVNLKNDFTI